VHVLLIMRIKTDMSPEKHIRVSYNAWQKLRNVAFNKNTGVKQLIDQILSGQLNPVTFEPIEKGEI